MVIFTMAEVSGLFTNSNGQNEIQINFTLCF